MRIKFPVTAVLPDGATFAHIVDSAGRVITGGGSLEDTEQLVAAANAGAQRRKNKRQQIEDELKNSDYSAKEVGRDDVIYGPHDQLPQCGESVARLKR